MSYGSIPPTLKQIISGQEFDTRQAAEEAVSVYNEGTFLGSVIKVQLSHGGGKNASKLSEPGACFKCGHRGHWARLVPIRDDVYLS